MQELSSTLTPDAELDKLARRAYLHEKVATAVAFCGHKVTLNWAPSNHCEDCWQTYFAANPKLVHSTFQALQDGAENEIKQEFGAKFVKQFKEFVGRVQERGKQKQLEEVANVN